MYAAINPVKLYEYILDINQTPKLVKIKKIIEDAMETLSTLIICLITVRLI